MQEISSSTAFAAELGTNAEELAGLTRRVQREGEAQPRIDTTGWSGPASWACQLSLALLTRQLEECVALLRCAHDLTEAAAWEARTGA